MPAFPFSLNLKQGIAVLTCMFLVVASHAQTPAKLVDIGPSAPTPGPYDITQFSNSGVVDEPDGLDYYTDNGVNHPAVGEPGQTFTTGASAVTLSSVAFKTGGGEQSNLGSPQSYVLHLYSVSGSNATLMASLGVNNFVYTNGDWLRWSGFSLILASNSSYAYSFGRAPAGTGYSELYNASNNPYAGGQIALIPPDGGSMTFGASNEFDGVFDLGLSTPAFPSAVLAANPVGYWRLNETGATTNGTLVAADAANNFNGLYGIASTDDVPGPTPSAGFPGLESENTAAEFTNGVPNSFVTLPALNLNTNSVSITAWIYPIGTPAYYAGIVICRPTGGGASGFCFTVNGQIGYTWSQYNSQHTWGWLSGLAPPLGQWSFVALVVSPSNAVVYLCNTNGQISATNAVPNTVETFGTPTLIGDDNYDGGTGSRTFYGVMDEVAIFNYDLTPDQVLNFYFNAAGGLPRVGATTASPSNTVYAGTTVTLGATVLGLQPLYYQWQSNAVSIAGATDATLVLTNAVVSDSASYDLMVSNSFGANSSAPVGLTVLPASAPLITQQPAPASATNYVGGLVTFTATVNGTPPIQLQWEHNGVNIPNATASSLMLASLQASQAGSYTLVASSSLGVTNSLPAILTVLPPPNPGALNVLTYHNDNTRQGANTNEVLLTLANVNVATFGRLITYPVDGYIYTQPLYVANLVIPGLGTHNAVFVATENNSVYAFDADGNVGTNGGLLWQTNLGTAALSNNHEFGGDNYTDIVPEVGITGTPAIDLASGTLYVDARTRVVGATVNYYHSVHALNITNGAEQPYSPVIVTNSVPGQGVDNFNGVVTFNPRQENQRPGMTLAGGMLYVAYGSFADADPYHGWVIGFNATNLQASADYVFNTTPNANKTNFGTYAGEGALWMSGSGLCVDANTNLYFETANGSFSANTNGGDYSDSFVRLSTSNGLAVADYFTPYNQLDLANSDGDLGSGGSLLLPDSVGSSAHPHLIVGAGKQGTIYLVDRDNMGHYNAANDSQIVQEWPFAIGGVWSSPAYFNNQIYYQGTQDVTKAFSISNAVLSGPVSEATTSFGALGGTPSISANGTNDGIVWTIQSDAYASGGPDVLHAYNATNLALELWNSSQNPARDNPGGAIEMTTPTVVNGKVYVGAEYALSIFGNSIFLATPVISPDGGLFTNAVTVTLSDVTPNSTIYYTLDGTAPSTNSIPYTGPFLLTKGANVQAMAAEFGAVNSATVSAGFVDNSAVGNGAGLLGQYWANTTAAAFTNINFTAQPTLTWTDAMINFNWSGTGPSSSIGQANFTARWTGCVQPEYSQTYTFTTVAEEGARLWINGQLLISGWTANDSIQTNSASLALKAQQLYNIQMDYFQTTGNGVAQLLWSSPSTSQALVPQTQLYPYTNPPPAVVLEAPTNDAAYAAAASVSFSAEADAPYNPLSYVSFYTNGDLLATVSSPPYAFTATGLAAGNYTVTATATDGSGLTSTSAPVNIVVLAGNGVPYGLTTNGTIGPFLNQNMPGSYTLGSTPTLLSQTGAYANTPQRIPSPGLIPYVPNTPLWSDNATKSRYMGVPNNQGASAPAQQIGFALTGQWTFPSGMVFVKNFDLVVDQTNPSIPFRRLETRLLVRDTNGAVYGVTYKWLPDNSDAVLLTNSLIEAVLVTNASGVFTENWYYPSPADCLTCHTKVESYVLGVNTRQLNGLETYPATAVEDNQLRTLNRLGLFYPAFNEEDITNFEQLSSVTNESASLEQRARSYLDANCAQCHQPGGQAGVAFDARYDTPLTNQNLINYPAAFSLGYDNAKIISPNDIWRSVLYDRMNTVSAGIKMPPLDRYMIDSNAVAMMAAWIDSLGGTPTLAPPILTPAAGFYTNEVTLSLESPDTNAAFYYTLDGTLPTTNSILYTGPFELTSSAVVTANAFETNFVNSVAVSGAYTIVPPLYSLYDASLQANGSFQVQCWAPAGQTYIFQTSGNLLNWTSLSTNVPSAVPFTLIDATADGAGERFYRVITP